MFLHAYVSFVTKLLQPWNLTLKISNEAASGTVNFLKIVLKLWKIFNVKNPLENQAHNDAMRAVIKMPDDSRIKFLLNVAAIADGMPPTTVLESVR